MLRNFFHQKQKEGKYIICVKIDGEDQYVADDYYLIETVSNMSAAKRYDTMADAHGIIAKYRSWFANETEDYQIYDV